MYLSDEQHRKLGTILGFPPCCVEEWIVNRHMAGARRGCIVARTRTPDEIDALLPGLTDVFYGRVAEAREWLDSMRRDPRKCWVPCTPCMEARDAC